MRDNSAFKSKRSSNAGINYQVQYPSSDSSEESVVEAFNDKDLIRSRHSSRAASNQGNMKLISNLNPVKNEGCGHHK